MNKNICAAVIDDANGKVYIYGNVLHENYHIPGAQGTAWCAMPTAGLGASGTCIADEFFDGQQGGNEITLAHTPINDATFFVFLNGIKQREGSEYDYTVTGKKVKFNFYTLIATDRVEINYRYAA